MIIYINKINNKYAKFSKFFSLLIPRIFMLRYIRKMFYILFYYDTITTMLDRRIISKCLTILELTILIWILRAARALYLYNK